MGRLEVKKTNKLFIGGGFPRSESGRVFPVMSAAGEVVARVAQGSRKDIRMAVRAARKAQQAWAERSGYNRGQILYRIAEMIEDRSAVFALQLDVVTGQEGGAAEVAASIDRIVWYAGWADKFAQVYGNLNPVAGPFFNVSVPEPCGVVAAITPHQPALLGLADRVCAAIVTGNTVVAVPSSNSPIAAVAFAEATATADVPGGVINLVTGYAAELGPVVAGHMDVNSLDLSGVTPEEMVEFEVLSAENLKRVVVGNVETPSAHSIAQFTETKTVWHPKAL